MAQTLAERQRLYRQRKKENFKRLDILIPTTDINLFIANAKMAGVTKAVYLSILLHCNDEADGKAQAGLDLMTDLHTTTLKEYKKEITHLKQAMKGKEKAFNTLSGNLKAELMQLKAQPHKCQCFKKDGNKCTKTATHELKKGNLLIYVCSMHHKIVTA